jgi:hypothetical protein
VFQDTAVEKAISKVWGIPKYKHEILHVFKEKQRAFSQQSAEPIRLAQTTESNIRAAAGLYFVSFYQGKPRLRAHLVLGRRQQQRRQRVQPLRQHHGCDAAAKRRPCTATCRCFVQLMHQNINPCTAK